MLKKRGCVGEGRRRRRSPVSKIIINNSGKNSEISFSIK